MNPLPSPSDDRPEIVVVPHTHWDREWYLPFQRFRMGLVRMLDDVLSAMDEDPAYRFTMDGQLAAVEDYLEIRPARRGDVARFVAEGRFAVGPWLILSDEFLCSGETLIRNLEYGMRGSAALGGAMRVGYLPDQFGHCAQMPQILASAGLREACLWRGVPAHVDRDAFVWTGADGTAVTTRYLPGGYGNAVALLSGPPEGLPDRVAAFASSMDGWRSGGPLLAMYGADHSAPSREITRAGLRVATLGEFMDAAAGTHDGDLPRVTGELRSHARANILPGVISARVGLKQAMARAERVLTRYAEPLSALWLSDRTASARLLDLAWRRVIACSGHDSVTGCGADDTAQQVAARIAEAEQIGQAVVDLVGSSLAASAGKNSVVVVNPSPFERSGLVLADLPERSAVLVAADGRAAPVQRLEHAPTLLDETVMDDLARLLGRVHERELFGHEIVSWALERPGEGGGGVFTVTVSRHASGAYAYEDLRQAILHAGPGPWTVRTLAEPVVTVAAHVTVPPLGRAVLTARGPVFGGPRAGLPGAVLDGEQDAATLDNGLLRVQVAADGTLSLRSAEGVEVHGVGRVAHGGDVGDTYNYAPPPLDRVRDVPVHVSVEQVHAGPLVSVLDVVRTYEWPADGHSTSQVTTDVRTRVELRAGEPYARCEVSFDVGCRDHRIRWHAPLPAAADESFAEGQLAVVRRGLTAEGGGGEEPVPTFPAESFVAAGGLAVLLDHVSEYELVGARVPQVAEELALTLVRSVGLLSGNRNPHRDEPAGPQVATPAAQCPGPFSTRFAVLPYSGTWHEAELPRLAEEFRHELLAVPGSGPSAAASERRGLMITGDGVMMAALRERDGWLEIRLVAEHPVATEAVIHGGFTGARLADALGSPAAPLDVAEGSVRLPLRPFEIATVQVSWL
ncbi:glycoside hydrolase family 38 C-terminal domain-containing protein [Planotetraspora phitsanulokensis]|uniref:glycoside hydrolase family 38 N-terminal domain-containing protein n=1 Tax=Planotetraspora phitsanulokensis TaxID=575192 RepID=UPI001EF3C795|nr:glycoside hydrolase family 38 C-terminal domain-containing protein [Planotetraspora phitsanulokensis]